MIDRIAGTTTAGEKRQHRVRPGVRRTPIRILIVGPSLDILGGQAVQAARLLNHLGREPELEVSFLPINPRLPGLLRKLQTVKYLRTVVTSLLYVTKLLVEVRKNDIIHIFSASYLSFVLAPTPAILVAKLYGKKIILNYRSGAAEDHLTRWRRTALPTMRLADAIATPSGYLVQVFAKFKLQARFIFNTVDTNRFQFRARRPLRPVFFSNRNLEPLYNVGCILRAFAVIQRRFPEAQLTIAGDGSMRSELERLARELELQNTVFIGRIPHDRMNELYAGADIYLNSSNIDNMPGSIIESFASGLPVVTTDAGGIPYIVSHEQTGLMVARGDSEGMAACAIRLLEDESLAEKITANALSECEKYRWEAVSNQWVDLYYELAGNAEPIAHEHSTVSGKPVRVLIVAPSLDILGGQAVQASCMLNFMKAEAGLDVAFLPINPRLPGPLRRLQAIKYVRTVVTSLSYLGKLLTAVPRYDVIHVFSASYLSFMLAPVPAVLISKLFGKRVVLNYHSGEAEDHLTRWRKTALPIIRLADVVAVPSDYLVKVFARFGFQARAIFNTVDQKCFRFRSRRPMRPVFLSNRNLEPLYNVGCILRAFAIVQQRFPEARLTIAGDGSRRAELEKVARELNLRNAEFVGRIPFERMCDLYAAADIYLNSSDIDNMPGSILESFASGLPVVTTEAGGIPVIVANEETGLIVKRGDHEALASCAIRLLENESLAEKITANALAECEKYTWESVRTQWINLYYELAVRQLPAPEHAERAISEEMIGGD